MLSRAGFVAFLAFFGVLSFDFAFAMSIQIENPNTGLLISDQVLTGDLSFGTIDYFAMNSGGSLVDHVAPIGANNEILDEQIFQQHSGMLYIIGYQNSQAALRLNTSNMGTGSADLWVSYQGDLHLYLSPENANWSIGTVLQNSTHLLLPQDNTNIPLLGQGGILSETPFSESQPQIGFDLAARVNLEDQAGPKTGQLTFTLLAN